MTPAETLRLIILACAALGVVIWLRWLKVSCSMRWIAVAPLSWLVNLTAFYVARQFDLVTDIMTLNVWSSAVHLHALILLIAAGVLLCQR